MSNKTKHAALLNSLVNMQGNMLYAARRPVLHEAERTIVNLEQQRDELQAEVDRLTGLINTPHTDDWVRSVSLEAAHQQERWEAQHDVGKEPHDWFWLLGYLSGKALAAFTRGDKDKGLHHIISSSAALLNWHRHATGEVTTMRPGIDPVARGIERGK